MVQILGFLDLEVMELAYVFFCEKVLSCGREFFGLQGFGTSGRGKETLAGCVLAG